jgi:hypothetical protein
MSTISDESFTLTAEKREEVRKPSKYRYRQPDWMREMENSGRQVGNMTPAQKALYQRAKERDQVKAI